MEKLVLTPELVVQAFLETGLKPVTMDFGDGKTCGCLMTAVVKQYEPSSIQYDEEDGLRSSRVRVAFFELTGMGTGVISGFDSPELCPREDEGRPDLTTNFEFGKACRLHLEEVGLLEKRGV
jgi:hypothetical protein